MPKLTISSGATGSPNAPYAPPNEGWVQIAPCGASGTVASASTVAQFSEPGPAIRRKLSATISARITFHGQMAGTQGNFRSLCHFVVSMDNDPLTTSSASVHLDGSFALPSPTVPGANVKTEPALPFIYGEVRTYQIEFTAAASADHSIRHPGSSTEAFALAEVLGFVTYDQYGNDIPLTFNWEPLETVATFEDI